MDPSTQLQSTGRTQPPAVITPAGNTNASVASDAEIKIPTPQQPISGHAEHGPIQTAAVTETPQDPQEEDSVKPASQEVGSPTAPQQKEVQKVEVAPSVPEVSIEKSVENVIEKSPDVEKPDIPQEVKAVGVTHSGPGIPVSENTFAVKTLPMTYQQAAIIDKQTSLKESRHWLSELVMYVWRKLDPTIAKKGGVNK